MHRKTMTAFSAALLAGCASVGDTTANVPETAAASGGAASQELVEPAGFDSATPPQPGLAHPEAWPAYTYPWQPSAEMKARVATLVGKMTLEEKVGQVLQADLCCVTPEDAKRYHLGSILVGGNTGPNGDDFALAPEWLKAADAFYAASIDKSDGGVGVPIIWGIDAVHGNANIVGATIFPHNIGLGAMRDAELVERIGAVTAREIRVTGQEWTFAPTVAVPQDFRWGRSYEGYSSDPTLVASYVGAMLRGLQGKPDNQNLLAQDKVIASTKHFLADGGTQGGVDQGDAVISEKDLRDIHGRPYGPAIEGGVATVMASFSSWQGRKMTGNRSLLDSVLKERMDFGGFLVSDWNAHGQVEGCTNDSCTQAMLAGLDMYMAPDTWKAVYASLLRDAKNGTLPMSRLDDAVSRILMVKERVGLFTAGKPSGRPLSGQFDMLGAPEHRAVAREAVRKSLVLLKNQGVLPLKSGGRLLVAGDGADDVSRQSGGWTLSWQGKDLPDSLFPGATSMWEGLNQAVTAAGGTAQLSIDGSFAQKPDAAIVVFGEKPYAEFQGDRASLQLDPELTQPYETMRKLKAQGIPVVAVMITGRPLFANPALNVADAFVVAWLPGSEGGGVADVLVGDSTGKARYEFSGKLPTAWPRTAQIADGALFDFGYGLTYASPRTAWTALSDDPGVEAAGDARVWYANGAPARGWSLHVTEADRSNETRITATPTQALDGRMQVTMENYLVQEGATRFQLQSGSGAISLSSFDVRNIDKEANADLYLQMTVKVRQSPKSAMLGAYSVGNASGGKAAVSLPVSSEFVTYGLQLKCLRDKGVDMTKVQVPFVLDLTGPGDITIGDVRLGTDPAVKLPCN